MTVENTESNAEEGHSLRAITHGASLFFVGKITSHGLRFVFNLILTRVLGATLYGVYTYAKTVVGFFVVFARLGTGKSLLRFIPAYSSNPKRQNWVTGLAYLTALLGSVLIGISLFVFAPAISNFTLDEHLLVDVLRILAVVLPFNTLTNLTNSVFRALEKLEYQVIIADILKPIIEIVSIVLAFSLGFTLIGAVAALGIGAILTFGAALSLLYTRTTVQLTGERSQGSVFEFYNFSVPLTFKDLGQKLYTRIDILMVGIFLTGTSVGIYRVSIILATVLTLPLSGINQLFPPIASRLYADGEIEELESVYTILTRWIFTLVIPPALAMMVYSSEVLQLFGEEFPEGSLVLIFFAFAQLTNCAVGPSGFLLMMADHQYLNLANQWTLGVLNAVLNYVLIVEYGFIGAAVATAGTLAFINVVRVIEVWHMERISPYSVKYWKPIVAGICSGIAMFISTFLLADYLLLIIGSGTGLLVFVGVLLALGIEEEDLEFFEANIKPRFS